MNDSVGAIAFRKYGILVPLLLSLFLEILKLTTDIFPYSWFWVLSPIWIFFGGVFELALVGILHLIIDEGKK